MRVGGGNEEPLEDETGEGGAGVVREICGGRAAGGAGTRKGGGRIRFVEIGKQKMVLIAKARMIVMRSETTDFCVKESFERREGGTANRMALLSLDFRERICRKLSVDAEEVPFFGELMRVEDPEWEEACEKHMLGQALVMIVPWMYADLMLLEATKTVMEDTLTRNIWEIATIFDIGEPVPGERIFSSEGLLCDKVSVDRGSPYAEFVMRRLRGRFDFVCCDSPSELLHTSKGGTWFSVEGKTSEWSELAVC